MGRIWACDIFDPVAYAGCREALHEIFDMCDLDGNGLLSRDEFTWFNQRTSGEDVGDEEWAVVEGVMTEKFPNKILM